MEEPVETIHREICLRFVKDLILLRPSFIPAGPSLEFGRL
jgi:hypothetical protein